MRPALTSGRTSLRRRDFIALAGGMAVWPLAARAEQRMPVIGHIHDVDLKGDEPFLANVRMGLADYGYVEGQNFRFEFREANARTDLYPALYRELVDQKVSVLIANSTAKLEVAKAATQTIPIIFLIGSDPVENGFVASFNKPGGNMTGVFNLNTTIPAKQLQILHELVPSATKFAWLTDPANTTIRKLTLPHIQAAADSLGVGLINVYAHTKNDYEAAFDAAVSGGAGGMVVGGDPYFSTATILPAVAMRYRMPAIFATDVPVKAGGLIAYGSDQPAQWRNVGRYAARMLKGEKPADTPVLQAAEIRLFINLKAAAALGITVPAPLVARADELIE
jgi:putative ABC transport system substrate-binding protein